MTLVWWQGCIVASVAITGVEYLNRTGGFTTFREALLRTWVLILIAQWGLFYGWRGAPSMMMAWAVFFMLNFVMRLFSSHYAVRELLNPMVMAGAMLIFAGACLVKVGTPGQ